MPVVLSSRSDARQKLAELLDTIVELVAVYDHEPKDFGRRSPVATVHSDGSRREFADYAREWHRLLITLWWRRDDGAATESYLDNLGAAVCQTLLDNSDLPGYWQDLVFDQDYSEMGYFLIDGVQYRYERLRVEVFVCCE